jgi:predicted  nucleic acid-binding Zn-ribbon protein
MESKFYLYFVLLIGIIGGCYTMYLNQDMDALNQKLVQTKHAVSNANGQIENTQRQIDQKKEIADTIQLIETKKAEKETLLAEVKSIQDLEPALAEAMNQAIQKVRRESVGMSFPELGLVSGTQLKNAVIQKVDEEEIIIQHAEGVKRAKAADLPPELKDRFRLGALATSKPAPTAPSAEVVSAARQKYDKKLLDARLATERMQKDLAALKQQLSQAESDMNSATSATRKFYTKSRRDQISLQVQALESRVTNAEIELKRIEGSPPIEP